MGVGAIVAEAGGRFGYNARMTSLLQSARAWERRQRHHPHLIAAIDSFRRLALAWYRLRGGFPIRLHGKRYRLAPEDRKFWRRVAAGRWEPQTFTFFEHCLRPDSVCVDVGAWIGPTVLFAAARCRTVYAIEPDPVAYERLLANLRLNDITNVRPFHGALGPTHAPLRIANHKHFGSSETRTLAADGDDGHRVMGFTPAGYLDCWGIERIDLLKMDVEGAEFALVPAIVDLLARHHHKPHIHLSLHAPLLPEAERRAQLAAVAELAARYAFAYDKRLRPISPDDITGERYTHHSNEVALTDRALE